MPIVNLATDCPGYAEAARREDDLRAVPFLGLDERIAGLPVAPLTLRRLQWLTMANSPFLLKVKAADLVGTIERNWLDGKPGLENDIALFLWIVSPQFNAGSERAKRKFFRTHGKVLKMEATKVVSEMLEYIDEAFLDSEQGDGSRSFYSLAASITGFFHRAYGLPIDVWENSFWRDAYRRLTGQVNALDIPLKIVFQLIRVHHTVKNPDAKFSNKLSQPKIDEWMKGLNAKH